MTEDKTASAVPISAFMITFNNERTVERALKSLHWADEIVVVDSLSTDATPGIARRYTDRFEQRSWPGFRDQYQYAANQCRNEWAIFLDADEEIPPALAAEIRQELDHNSQLPAAEQASGFQLQRRTWYLGRWIMHGGWVPDRGLRLYRRAKGKWEGGLHASVKLCGATRKLKNVFHHYTYAGIGDHLKTIDRYSAVAAQDMIEAGKRFSLLKVLTGPLGRFVRDYFLKRGFLDGFPGLVVAVNTAFYVFIKHARLWELQHRPPTADASAGDP